MNAKQKEKSRWGPALPAVLGDRVMQLHERVLWRCAQGVCTAVGNEPWIALVGVEPTLVSPTAKFFMRRLSERPRRGQNGRRGSTWSRSTASRRRRRVAC